MSKSYLKEKNSRDGRMHNRWSKRMAKPPNPKPYGFCCSPDQDDPHSRYRRSVPTKTKSIPSLRSLHECPALRIREQIVVKRVRSGRSKDGMRSPRRSSGVKINLGSMHEAGGMGGKQGKTESEIEFMIDLARRQRQEEYERNMDRWAKIGEKRVKERAKKIIRLGVPHWYTEFSIPQLNNLKELKDAMFKDKEEKTTSRTWNNLDTIGIFTDTMKLEAKVIWKLIKEFSMDPIKFLCEIYKAMKGHYFQNEAHKMDYMCNEKIILSAIAFLELPKVILELHKRMPPVLKSEFPPKPKPPKIRWPKKVDPPLHPLLEKLLLPLDWRPYHRELCEWRTKVSEIPRPFAALPKQTRQQKDDEAENLIVQVDDAKQNKSSASQDNNTAVGEKTTNKDNNYSEKSSIMNVDKIDDNATNNLTPKANIKNSKNAEKTDIEKEKFTVDEETDKQIVQSFLAKPRWTEPPIPCPDKYRRLIKEKGTLTTNEEFFAELKPPAIPGKIFLPGRENMSLNMQHYLLNVEADFFHLTEEASRIADEVGRIAREIFDPEPSCDPCCACRQTRKTHLKWHATKTPHTVIDSVVTDEDKETHVIGAVAMHSPASSISSASQPPCVPSFDKLTKNLIIAGATTIVDGQVVNQVDGVTKVLEHVPREILRPDVDTVEIKNVYPCECAKEENDKGLDLNSIGDGKDKDLCYGQKFRPNEVRAYSCNIPETKPDATEDDDCGCRDDLETCLDEDDCGCDDDIPMCLEGDDEEDDKADPSNVLEQVVQDISLSDGEKSSWITCKRCGKKMRNECSNKDIKNAKSSKLISTKITTKCSCDSLSEFLQIDVTRTICTKPAKEYFQQELFKKEDNISKKPSEVKSKKSLDLKNKINRLNEGPKLRKHVAKDKNIIKKLSNKRKEETKKEKGHTKKKVDAMEKESIIQDATTQEIAPEDVDGPYGFRTASEEALPIERTIAYLTPLHPPDQPAEQIAVRPGGRACHCRENRNQRKTLLYGIGGHSDAQPLIEGIIWLTPEPSIRRSDEYIPEYELYDSPYDKQICGGPRNRSAEKGAREAQERKEAKKSEEKSGEVESDEKVERDCSKDWETAFADPYLNEFFTTKREKVPCWNRCAKFRKGKQEPRKLKVMKPVCECKYERRIVKRNEERKQWRDRQQRLKSLKKESFLHIHEITTVSADEDIINKEEMSSCIEKRATQTVIAGIAMQTPCATPSPSKERSNLPFVPIRDEEVKTLEELTPVLDEQSALGLTKHQAKSDSKKKKEERKKDKMSQQDRKSENINASVKNKKSTDVVIKEKGHGEVLVDTNDRKNVQQIAKEAEKESVRGTEAVADKTFKARERALHELEVKLISKMKNELEEMKASEDFVSLKLPNYHRMPQLYYWISYRVRGMHFTEKYKKDMMDHTEREWSSKEKRIRRITSAQHFHVTRNDQQKVTFEKAKYWKRKVGKMKSLFYTQLRQDYINLGLDMWRAMEFGKFPNVLFKQAYFTYLPSRDRDAVVFRPWPL